MQTQSYQTDTYQTDTFKTDTVSKGATPGTTPSTQSAPAQADRPRSIRDDALEPGLLPVLRIYVFLRFGAMVLVAGVFLGGIGVPFEPEFVPTGALFILEIVFFLVYLYWSPVRKKLGSLYLPIALLVASAGPILEMRYVFTARQPDYIGEFWLIFPFLSIPLILMAWQYSYREVVWFCVSTAMLDLGLVMISHQDRAFHTFYSGGSVLTRTLFFLVIGKVVSSLMEAQRLQRRQLARANRRLVRYASTIEQLSVTRERNRLAQEMHDTLAHTLSALAVELDALSTVWTPETSRARRILDHALATTRDGLDETRRALKDMRASPLEDLGLARAVRTLARNTAERCGLQLTLRGPEDFGDLPPEVEHTYYRVAQEALENVVRHADAQTLLVGLTWEGRELVLTVEDDGKGLPEPILRDRSHFGLCGMRERAEFIGGALTIASEPDGGTTIILRTEVHDAWRDV